MQPVRLAVVGAGLIGKGHLEEIERSEDVRLVAIVEPGLDGVVLCRTVRRAAVLVARRRQTSAPSMHQ